MPRSIDRTSFVYLDRCSINVDGGAIVAWRDGRRLILPSASIISVILGPGTKITHDAIKMMGCMGTCVLWMGADQTRFYAVGRPLSSSSKLIERQAEVVSNKKKRLACAKKMYGLRFEGIDTSSKNTMRSLMGMEGARMKRLYSMEADRVGIKWLSRLPTFESIEQFAKDYDHATVNRSLTIGNNVLYAVIMGILNAIGMSPALGIIHCGRADSFVYDVADLIKASTSIPVAFDVTIEHHADVNDVDRRTRFLIREKIREQKILNRIITFLKQLFMEDCDNEKVNADDLIWLDEDSGLWDASEILLPSHKNYGESLPC